MTKEKQPWEKALEKWKWKFNKTDWIFAYCDISKKDWKLITKIHNEDLTEALKLCQKETEKKYEKKIEDRITYHKRFLQEIDTKWRRKVIKELQNLLEDDEE